MRLLFTGATGFIGRAAISYFQGKGYSITAWVRDVEKAKDLLGTGIHFLGPNSSDAALLEQLELADGVINLAGSPISGVRWTNKNKQGFFDSRVTLTHKLADHINRCKTPPKVFISASAIGIYGDKATVQLTEESQSGKDFLAKLCLEWEQSAKKCGIAGTRVCLIRFGIVLGKEGGILRVMGPTIDMSISSFTGNGKQYISWIHLLDAIRVLDYCLISPAISGAINCTAPNPITAKGLAQEIAKISKSRFVISVPSITLKLLFGEGQTVLTNSHNALPQKLSSSNFIFRYPEIGAALTEELDEDNPVNIRSLPHTSDNVQKKGQYELSTKLLLNTDAQKAFSFFSSPENLGLLTPSWLNFRIIDFPKEMKVGAEITYSIKLWLFRFKWITTISEWNPNETFIDFQKKGPYSLWWHQHRINKIDNNSSSMEDKVIYRMPFGIIGILAHRLFVRKLLRRIFNYRRTVIRFRFNSVKG